MKSLIYFVLIISPYLSFGQKKNSCKENIENGKFVLLDSISGNTLIERRGRFQIEEGARTGLKVKLKIKWIDDCRYSLQLIKVLENPNKLPLPPNARDIIIIAEILSVSQDSYVEITSSNVTERTKKRTILIK